MNSSQRKRIADKLDSVCWKNPNNSIKQMCVFYEKNTKIDYAFGSGHIKVPIPPDYRDLAKVLIRGGQVLTKEKKKKYGIHHSAKATTTVFEHFTEKGLPFCIKEAKVLALSVSAVENCIQKLNDWGKNGELEIEWAPAPDACSVCKNLAGNHLIEKAPIPVLDTHLGCRCSYKPVMVESNKKRGSQEKEIKLKNIRPTSDAGKKHVSMEPFQRYNKILIFAFGVSVLVFLYQLFSVLFVEK